MSVRVWQSRNGSDTWADWEMSCPDHPDEHSTSPTWMWAMELAWGHIAMHHGGRRSVVASAWDEGALWAAVECGAIDNELTPWLMPGDNPHREQP